MSTRKFVGIVGSISEFVGMVGSISEFVGMVGSISEFVGMVGSLLLLTRTWFRCECHLLPATLSKTLTTGITYYICNSLAM